MCARGSKAWMSGAGDGVVFTLNEELRVAKGIMVAAVIDIEMRGNHRRNVFGAQPQRGEMLEHICFVRGRRHPDHRSTREHPTIDENVLSIAHHSEIAAGAHFQS